MRDVLAPRAVMFSRPAAGAEDGDGLSIVPCSTRNDWFATEVDVGAGEIVDALVVAAQL
jgi:hypothetical protein